MLKLSFRPEFTAKQNEPDLGLVYKLLITNLDSGALIHASELKYSENVQELNVPVDAITKFRVVLLAPYAVLDQDLDAEDKNETMSRKQTFETPVKVGSNAKANGKRTSKKAGFSKIGCSNLDSESKLSEENGVYKYEGGAGMRFTPADSARSLRNYQDKDEEDLTHVPVEASHLDNVISRKQSPSNRDLHRIREMASGLGNNISVKRLRTAFTNYPSIRPDRPTNLQAENPQSSTTDIAPTKVTLYGDHPDFSAFSFGAEVAPTEDLFRIQNPDFPAFSLRANVMPKNELLPFSEPNMHFRKGFNSSRASQRTATEPLCSVPDSEERSFFRKATSQSFFKAAALPGGGLKELPSLAAKISEPRNPNNRSSQCIFSKEFTDAFF